MRDDLSALLGAGPVEAYLVPDMLIRHIVVTIDHLPREPSGKLSKVRLRDLLVGTNPSP